MMGIIEVRLCSLRYEDCNSSKSSIRFTTWCYRNFVSLSVAFATSFGIVAVMALLIATVSAGV